MVSKLWLIHVLGHTFFAVVMLSVA